MDEASLERLCSRARDIRKLCLELAMHKNPGATHFGGAMSTVEILTSLYFSVLRYETHLATSAKRDRFFLSKGHSVLAYYATLHLAGFISYKELFTYGTDGSFLAGHPIMNKQKGIEFTNGSLGMGLSVALGHALAGKLLKQQFHTYVLMGDGECNEGSVWEAIMAAPHLCLNNITAIIDNNKYQQTGSNAEIMGSGSLVDKFRAFGWNVLEVDGHDIKALNEALNPSHKADAGPTVIIANTIKGKGFSFSEGNNAWHHAVITNELFRSGLIELGYRDG